MQNTDCIFYFFLTLPFRYMLKEDGVKPPSDILSANLITKEDIITQKNYIHWLFADVAWAATSYREVESSCSFICLTSKISYFHRASGKATCDSRD